jgi:hypothetical protein
MGNMWVKDVNGWKTVFPWIKTASGWSRVKTGYRKINATTWQSFFVADLTPPAVPVISSIVQEGTRLKITITAPASTDVKVIRVKVGKVPAANTDIDSSYVSSPDGSDTAWSEWKVTPSQARTKYYPVSGSLTNGALYYVTAWSQDGGRNYSQPAVASHKYTAPVVPVPVKKTAFVTSVDSGSFYRSNNTYLRTDKILRTGRPEDRMGLWYYSNKIATTLKNAKSLDKVQVLIQRYSGAAGYVGQSKWWFFAHNQTAYSNVDMDAGGRIIAIEPSTINRLLARGASGTATMPPSWYPDILSGKIKGFGVIAQVSSGINEIDIYAGEYYGFGTNSGRVYLEYTE